MRPDLPRRIALAGCLASAALLTLYQLAPGLGHPPLHLYALFTGVWLFGAAMLWKLPTFGAVGTAAYGVLLGANLLTMHATRAQNVVLALVFFATALAALAHLAFRGLRRE